MKSLNQNKITTMKKMNAYLVPVMALIVIAFTFTACDKDEAGVYNPGKKISKIYVKEDNAGAQLAQQWTWDGKLLTKIEYYDENVVDGFETFTYDGKKLIKITDNYAYYASFTYDEKHFAKVEYFNPAGTLISDLTFTYTEDKITGLILTDYGQITKQYVTMLQRGILGKVLPKVAMDKVVEKAVAHEGNHSKSATIITLVYDGDNISTLSVDAESLTFTAYDSKVNPLFNFAPFSTFEESANTTVFSKNNPGTQTYIDGALSVPTNYTYEYDGDYPTMIKGTTTYGGSSFISTQTIEYL